MAERDCLAGVYAATTYRLVVDGGPIDLRVGARHPRLDDWLKARGADRWAYLTADNPGSVVLLAADNAARRAALMRRLSVAGECVLRGEAIADAPDWPTETGVLIAGISRSAAVALAAEFGQVAILAAAIGEPVQLVWVDPDDAV